MHALSLVFALCIMSFIRFHVERVQYMASRIIHEDVTCLILLLFLFFNGKLSHKGNQTWIDKGGTTHEPVAKRITRLQFPLTRKNGKIARGVTEGKG